MENFIPYKSHTAGDENASTTESLQFCHFILFVEAHQLFKEFVPRENLDEALAALGKMVVLAYVRN